MFPCLVLKNAATVTGIIVITSDELDDNAQPKVIWTGTVKGNYQVSNIEQISGNDRTLLNRGSYLVPAKYIPEQGYAMCGGKLKIKGQEHIITEIIPNYDLSGNLNYWRIITA